jgi:murein L,D-transpeptidase YafK
MKKWTLLVLLWVLAIAGIYYFYPEQRLPPNTKIDELRVIKSERIMEAYSNGKLLKTYTVSIGQNPVGDKESQGDKRTPEGNYRINDKNPNSGFHKNLGVSYPNADDRQEAAKKGVNPGGDIKIHGLKNGLGFIGKFHRWLNWTAGCIAVTDEEMDELYEAVNLKTSIVIKP